MALLKCIDCGHDVSSRALRCPNCGCPISAILAAPTPYSESTASSCDYCDDDNYSCSDYIADYPITMMVVMKCLKQTSRMTTEMEDKINGFD